LTRSPTKARAPKKILESYSAADAFTPALVAAKAASTADPFSRVFRVVSRCSFPSELVGRDAERATVRSDGSVVIVNRVKNNVGLYKSDGMQMSEIGGKGREQGYLRMARDAASVGDSEIGVSDFRSRILIYSTTGSLRRSLLFSRQKFSCSRVVYDDISRRFMLFGNTADHTSSVHEYSDSGQYLRSFVPLERDEIDKRLISYVEWAVDSDNGIVYTAVPFLNAVHALYPDGSERVITPAAENFKPPSTMFRIGDIVPADFARYLHNWVLESTPIVNIAVVHHKWLLVQTQTFSPLRYTIAIRELV
jgi:hypothetical protein